MNGNIFDPRVYGLTEVIEKYRKCLNNVSLYGPTYFNEVISMVNGICEFSNAGFHVLLIITDGEICDL